MSLVAGTRLGPYEILSPIGAGGMGEVYRAKDTKLKRDVAIKVLPESVAGDAERLARFEREAQSLAALNHPNIAAVYAVEGRAIVMELVDGDDLSALIARGPLAISEALPIARQIADALEAAHEHGIIHRDLKPANIKVRGDGTVKVLDFGLAKAMARPSHAATAGEQDLAMNSPTMTSPAHLRQGSGGQAMTAMGMILGTAAYMSPEQAKGRAVDKRADIWAFGVVLYEMLTGRRLFDARDVSDTLAAVLTREVSFTSMPPGIPPRLRALLRECLVRDPKQRLRDIGDARLVLDKITAGASDDPVVSTAAAASSPSRALPWLIAGLVTVALAIALWAPWRTLSSLAPRRLLAGIGADASLTLGLGSAVILSPDGTTMAFAAQQGGANRLFVRRLDQLQALPLPGTEGASGPFFSPNGQWTAFFASAALKKVAVTGGAPVQVCEAPTGRGGTWSDDDTIYFTPSSGPNVTIMRVAAAGGTPVAAGVLSAGAVSQRWPQVLPAGAGVRGT